jgi:hypothetical protein
VVAVFALDEQGLVVFATNNRRGKASVQHFGKNLDPEDPNQEKANYCTSRFVWWIAMGEEVILCLR